MGFDGDDHSLVSSNMVMENPIDITDSMEDTLFMSILLGD